MNDQKKSENVFKKIGKIIIIKFIPFILGLLLWTGIKFQIIDYFQTLNYGLYRILYENFYYIYFIVIFICFLYCVLIKAIYGWGSTIWFILKMILFPVYLIYLFLSLVIKFFSTFYKTINNLWVLFSSPLIFLLLTILSMVLCLTVINTSKLQLAKFEIIALIILSTSSVIWLYVWTFHPLKSLNILGKLVDKIISLVDKQKKEETLTTSQRTNIDDEKNKKDKQKHDDGIDKVIHGLDELVSKLDRLKIDIILVNIFIILFIFITTLICINYAVCYYVIYLNNIDCIKVTVDKVVFLDFIMLSLRSLLLNDYARIIPISPCLVSIILVESINGIGLFVLLLLSFSTITSQKGKEYLVTAKQSIESRIERISQLKYFDDIKKILPTNK